MTRRGIVHIAAASILAAALVLSGCANQSGAYVGASSVVAPVIAILQDDLFVGEAHGYFDRTGKLDLRSALDDSVRCVGQFAYTGAHTGAGSIRCNDGSEAQFSFNALTTLSGYGYGKSSRGAFSFTYGLTAHESTEYLKLPAGRALRRDKERRLVLTPV